MSRASRQRSNAKRRKAKKRGPGPGDKKREVVFDIPEDTQDFSPKSVSKDPVKVDKSRNDAPTTQAPVRRGPRGG